MTFALRLTLLLATAAPLAACETPLNAPLSSSLGQAVASMDSQIVPAAYDDAPPEGSGAQAVGAVTRYQTDKVKKPPAPGTSEIGAEVNAADQEGSSK